jgi:hypothetical protein
MKMMKHPPEVGSEGYGDGKKEQAPHSGNIVA